MNVVVILNVLSWWVSSQVNLSPTVIQSDSSSKWAKPVEMEKKMGPGS